MSIKISDLAVKLGMTVSELRQKVQEMHMGVSSRANVFRDDLAEEIQRRMSSKDRIRDQLMQVALGNNLPTDEPEDEPEEPVEKKAEETSTVKKTSRIEQFKQKFDLKSPEKSSVQKDSTEKKPAEIGENKSEIGEPIDVIEEVVEQSEDDEDLDDTMPEVVEEPVSKQPVDDLVMVEVPDVVTVGELAGIFGLGVSDVIKELMKNGVLANINERIDFDTAAIIGQDLGFNVQPATVDKKDDVEDELGDESKYDKASRKLRPPIVTVMGHVDHGKTSILDKIRESNVVAGESGGITQHMGAYQVVKNDRKITFLDTPGHKAFTAMRAHGVKLTDIAVLVVAADDGVKPQTIEAINHAKAAGVPIIVALNKIDRVESNVDRVKRELADYDLIPEEWGGKTIMVNTSAKTGEGIDTLLEMILLVADLEDLQAYFSGPAQGVVIEAYLSKRVGPVATVLITQGELAVKDSIVVGLTDGVVRAMIDHQGMRITQAYPADPIRLAGLNDVPEFGDSLYEVESGKMAKVIVEDRRRHLSGRGFKPKSIGMAELSQAVREGKIRELPIILKADVQGSIEAIRSSLENIFSEEVRVNILHEAVGAVNESDVLMASSSQALILAFNVKIEPNAGKMAKKMGVEISEYDIIYRLIEDVKAALEGLLDPELVDTKIGRGKILKIFTHGKKHRIVGVAITKGIVEKASRVVVFRHDKKFGEGKVDEVRKGTDTVNSVSENNECGVGISGDLKLEEGDMLEFWKQEKKIRRLDENKV